MRATIAYYNPPRRPAAGERPDFAALPLAAQAMTVSDMRAAGGGFCLAREGKHHLLPQPGAPLVVLPGHA